MQRGRVLLTGATGFIGSYLVDLLLAEGYQVVVALRPQSNAHTLTGKPVERVALHYQSVPQMQQALAESGTIDYVVHTAGITKTNQPSLFREVNAENTRRLLAALPNTPKCFLLMSSMGSFGCNPSAQPLRSDMPRRPNTEYGRSKLLAEEYVVASGIPYVILCPTGVYGYGEQDYLLAIKSMMKGVNFLSGCSPQLLSFVYVKDVARAVHFLLQEPLALGNTYLLSDGNCYTDTQYTQTVAELLRHRVRNIRVPLPVMKVACWAGGVVGKLTGKPSTLNPDKYHILAGRNWSCDISPILALGFRPKYNLRDGLYEAFRLASLLP